MRDRIVEENIIHTLNIELDNCNYFLRKPDYLAALAKIQSALRRLEKISSKQKKDIRAIVPNILEQAFQLINKLEKEHATSLAEQAFRTALP